MSFLGVAVCRFPDFDRDGRVDAAVLVHNAEPLLLHNQSERLGSWLSVRLVGTGKNRWAIGAKVVVRTIDANDLERRHTAWSVIGESYAGSHSLAHGFGLGSVVRADVEITWPDGSVGGFESVPLNRGLIFDQRSGNWREAPTEPIAPRPWGELTALETDP